MPRPFRLVDVFGETACTGNPLAVVAEAEGLADEQMLALTRWLNLSETTFLLAPTDPRADYRVRIFTLAGEMPFAGHPTLGTCHAWLEMGGRPRGGGVVTQECGAGLVRIRRGDSGLGFAAPDLIRGGAPSKAELLEACEVLGIDRDDVVDATWADNGPGWIALMLATAEAVLKIEPARRHRRRIDVGVVGPHPPGADPAFELRAFFTDAHLAIVEDPVTGSLNASVGGWLFASGRASKRYVAAQGTRLGRRGRVVVEQDDAGRLWVAGRTRTLVTGDLRD